MICTGDSFEVPHDQREHFPIRFSRRVADQIEGTLSKPCLRNFSKTLEVTNNWSPAQIAEVTEEAPGRMPPTVAVNDLGSSSMEQCAIYDRESCDWLFVDFD